MAERASKSGAKKVSAASDRRVSPARAGLAKTVPVTPIPQADDVPATCGLLRAVRNELILRIDHSEVSLRGEMQAIKVELQDEMRAIKVELRQEMQAIKVELQGEIRALRQEVRELQVQVGQIQTTLAQVQVDVARMLVLVEEQNARNKVVLDGLAASFARHERTEERLDALEKRTG